MERLAGLVDTFRERQPLRNAVRGLLGRPLRRSTVIDPMEEMSARDREMGGDVSNPFPQQKRIPARPVGLQASAVEELPEPSAIVQPPIEAIRTPAPAPQVDETQPFKGQNVFSAMFRTPQEGLDVQRRGGRPATPAAQPRGGLSPQMAAINAAEGVTAADKLDAHANLMHQAAADAAMSGNRDAMQTYVRLGEAYAQRANALRQYDAAEKLNSRAIDFQTKQLENQMSLPAILASAQAAQDRGTIDYNIRQNAAEFDRQQARLAEAGSTATSFQNYEGPLQSNPGLSVSEFAGQMAEAVRGKAAESGKPVDPAAVQSAYDTAYRTGARVRIGQYLQSMAESDDAPVFDDTHPGFAELQAYYGRKLAQQPGEYDQLFAELTGIVAPAVRAATDGMPPEDQMEYIRAIIEGDGESRGLLGPKVNRSWFWGE